MVMPDGSNLRLFQIVVGMLTFTAIALLLRADPHNSRRADFIAD
jgi:hypothetical protein